MRFLSIPKVTAHYADVSDPESVEACIAEVIAAHGKIDNLVTSAGFTENFEAINYPTDRMRKLWGVNVDGTYLFATSVARHLMERKSPGSMVMIGSMSGSIVNVPQPQAYVLDAPSLLPGESANMSSSVLTTPPRLLSATSPPPSPSSGRVPASASTASLPATC